MTEQKSSQGEIHFPKWRQDISEELTHAGANIEIFKGIRAYMNIDTRHRLDVLNQAPDFWGYACTSNLQVAILRLWKVGLDKKSASLPNLLDYVEKHKEEFSESALRARMSQKGIPGSQIDHDYVPIDQRLRDARASVMEMRPNLRELERWRHKRIAHLELKEEVLAKVKTSRSYRIRITQIEEIIGSCWDVYNQISVAYDSSVFADPHLTYRSDVKRSLSKVLEGMELYWETLNRNA